MQNFVDQVAAAIRGGQSSDIADRLVEAALLFEKFRGSSSHRGISTTVDAAEITTGSIAILKVALMEFVQRCPAHPAVGSGIWALGKLRDKALRVFFISEMRRHLYAGKTHPVWQADCALADIGGGSGYDYIPGTTSNEAYFQAVRGFLEKNSV